MPVVDEKAIVARFNKNFLPFNKGDRHDLPFSQRLGSITLPRGIFSEPAIAAEIL